MEQERYLIQQAREAFSEFDKNNTGSIAALQLISVLRSLGYNPTDNEIQDMINQVDVEGTGQIDFTDFAKFLVKLNDNQGDMEEETMQLFRRFDVESEGKIDVSEMKFVLKNLPVKLNDDEVEEMLTAVDRKQEGEINFQQFRTMLGLT